MSLVSYGTILEQQAKTVEKPRLLLAGAVLVAASFSPAAVQSGAIYMQNRPTVDGTNIALCLQMIDDIAAEDFAVKEITRRVQELVNNPELRDDDEPAPPERVVNEVISLIQEASCLIDNPMPAASVSTFFGELNVTWRSGDDIVRIACFGEEGRASLIQFGNVSAPLGSYRSELNATAESLARHLSELLAVEAVAETEVG